MEAPLARYTNDGTNKASTSAVLTLHHHLQVLTHRFFLLPVLLVFCLHRYP